MQGSINFDGSLVGNITGGGGGGDTVVITPVVTSGTKIADVSVNGVERDLYCPTPPTPPQIDITPVVTSGTKIADISVGGVEKDLYAPNPTEVNVNQVQQSGTKIATIGVNGQSTDIYAPEGGGSDVEITPVVTSGTKIADVSVGGVEKDLYTPDYGADITEIKQSLSQLDGLLIYKDLTPTDNYAEFNDGSNLPLISLISNIEPIQSGSGTPSPDNPRSISGHTDIDIIVSPNSDFSGGSTYSVNFVDGGNPLTVYGGTLDVISGAVAVDRKFNTLTELTYLYNNGSNDVVCGFIQADEMMINSRENGISNYFKSTSTIINQNTPWRVCFGINNKRIYFTFDPLIIGGNTLENINNYVATNPIQVVYPLATPITYQLTPTQVNSLLGQNYISSDVGDITNVKYLGVLNLS